MPAGGLGAVGPQTPDSAGTFKPAGLGPAVSKFPAGWPV